MTHGDVVVRDRITGTLWFAWSLLLAPSDLVMARSMLRGIKPRAESTGPADHRSE